MELVIERYGALPCRCREFTINGMDADEDDFGEGGDVGAHFAEPHGCGDYVFAPIMATDEVLAKYKITLNEYREIAFELRTLLSAGTCNWCV